MSLDNGRKQSTGSAPLQRNSQQEITEENGGVEKRMSNQSGGGKVRNSKGSIDMQPTRKSGSIGERRASYNSGSGGARAGSYGSDGRRSSGERGYRPSDAQDDYYAMREQKKNN